MSQDKYTATWVSYSSINDFLNCPQAYFLKNVYKDPVTYHKIQIVNPALSLGQAIHNVLDVLSALPRDQRFSEPLSVRFESEWKKVSGEKGGYLNSDQEYLYKKRGLAMLNNVYNNPGPLSNLAVKINQDLPQFWLSEEDNIILCGKLDWLEYFPESNSVHIIDFKTGRKKEDSDSLQLPIYHLLASNCQERLVTKASYWYLEGDKNCQEQFLPDLKDSYTRVIKIARDIKLARQLEKFKCPNGQIGCFACQPFKKILAGEGNLVGQDDYNRDIYILKEESLINQPESEVL